MEEVEAKNYNTNLESGRAGAASAKAKGGLGLGMLLGMIYVCQAYSFFVGSWYVEAGVINRITGEPYNFGDVLSVFYCIVSGLMGVAMSGNHLRGIAEAKQAGKKAFDIIDRVPKILLEDPLAEEHKLDGSLELKNVNFYYPTRPDKKILNNLSIKERPQLL
jgi:ATP-binding cassette subfamily B (MDR/TAP) protein 1